MTSIFRLLLLLSVSSVFIACDSDEPESEYYVRYTAIAEPLKEVNMYFTDVTGDNTYLKAAMPDGKFQYCIGPVKRGFKAGLTVSYVTGGAVSFLSIEVAKDTEPFVIKSQGTNYFTQKYTIE